MKRRRILTIAGLSAVAGCLDGPIGTDGEKPSTVAENLHLSVPGVGDDASVDDEALLAAHESVLGTGPATLVSERGLIEHDPYRTTVTIGPGGGLHRAEVDKYRWDEEVWVTDDEAYRYWTTDGIERMQLLEDVEMYPRGDLRIPQFETVIRAGNFYATGTETRDGEEVVVLEAQSVADRGAADDLWYGNYASGFEATALVTESGAIVSLTCEGTFEPDDARTQSMRTTYELSDVGTAELARPDWVDRAGDEAVRFDVDRTDEYVALEFERGEPISDGVALTVYPPARNTPFLTESIEEGDTLYVATVDGALTIRLDEVPEDAVAPDSSELRLFSVQSHLPVYIETIDE